MKTVCFLLLFAPLAMAQELYVSLEVPVGISTLNTSLITSDQICFTDDADFTLTADNDDFSTPITQFTLDLPTAGSYRFTALPCAGAAFSYGIIELVASLDGPIDSPPPPPPPLPGPTETRNIHFSGHSLIFEEEQNVPHWMNQLATLGGRDFAATGQYGFTPSVPAFDQLGWPGVPIAWSAGGFSEVTDNVMTVLNFALSSPPTEAGDLDRPPADDVIAAIDWAKLQNPDVRIWIYESWADAGTYISEVYPMSPADLTLYHEFNRNENAAWYDLLMTAIHAVHPDVTLVPVARIIAGLNVDVLPLGSADLYVDSAPHGTPTTYFLAALVSYLAMYDDFPERMTQPGIDSRVLDYYPDIVYYIKDRL